MLRQTDHAVVVVAASTTVEAVVETTTTPAIVTASLTLVLPTILATLRPRFGRSLSLPYLQPFQALDSNFQVSDDQTLFHQHTCTTKS